MHSTSPTIAGRAASLCARALLAAGIAAAVAGCDTTMRDSTGLASGAGTDYRQRHPIVVKEGKRTLTLFVGAGRGGLSPSQSAEVLAFAQSWKRDATGGITIDRPVGGPNERASLDTLKEVLSIIAQSGIPNHGVGIRPYSAGDNPIAALRLNYPQLAADAGPCGQWPDDMGPTYDTKHFENQHYHNFGCAYQRNLAAMVANPSDLVQPRSEGPIYTAKRTFGTEKWLKGQSPATTYPETQRGAISDLGR